MIVFSGEAQNVEYSIVGGINYSGKAVEQNEIKYDSYLKSNFVPIQDSFHLLTYSKVVTEQIETYRPKLGAEVELRARIGLGEGIDLNTGLGFSLAKFKRNTAFGSITRSIISVDTIAGSYELFNPFDNDCNYTNSFSSVIIGDRDPSITILSLMIPFGIAIDVNTDKYVLNVGGFLQTPIYTSIKRSFVTTEMEEVNGETMCTYVAGVRKDNTGNDFQNLNFGAYLSLEYSVNDNSKLELGVRKLVTKIFNYGQSTFSIREDSYSPLYSTLRYVYQFGRSSAKKATNINR